MLSMIFNRKVVPLSKTEAKVEVDIVGFVDSAPYELGTMRFPTKQSWTKFWGAVQRGSISIQDMDVKLQNVPPSEEDLAMATPQLAAVTREEAVVEATAPQKRWVGNELVPDDSQKT